MMHSILKTIFACLLGLGFLVLESHSKPSLAFLGFSSDSDPRVKDTFAHQILFELQTDTSLFVFSKEEISMLYARSILKVPEIGSLDLPILSKAMGAQFYAYGNLESISSQSKRIWWKPWTGVTTNWNQGLRLRILDATQGKFILDSVATSTLTEKSLLLAPQLYDELSPLEQEKYIHTMMGLVAKSSAKLLSKVIKEKTQPVKVGSTSEAGNGDASGASTPPAP